MSKNRKQLFRRTKYRHLEIEALERRVCPAVTFAFDAGVLLITGDDGRNNIAIFQPRDRAVEVVGDGQRRTFSGVEEIFVDSKGGDDAFTASKPKEIVVVGSKLNIDVGAGNDTVKIDDGGPSRKPAIFNSALDVSVNLGTGADDLIVQVHHHDAVHLDVLSSDGGDIGSVGLLLPAVQKVREAAVRVSMELGGGDNDVEINIENVDAAELRLTAAGGNNAILIGMLLPAVQKVPEAAARMSLDLGGGNNNVQVGVTGRITGIAVDPDTTFPQVDLDLVAAGGSNSILIGLLVPAVQKVQEAAARMSLDLGGGGNVVDVNSAGIDDLEFQLTETSSLASAPTRQALGVSPTSFSFAATAAGVGLSPSQRAQIYTITFQGSLNHDTPGGNDSIWIDLGFPVRKAASIINLGDGPDKLAISSRNVADLQLDINSGGGDDSVNVDSSRPGVGILKSSDGGRTWNINASLGDGDDHLTINTAGYSNVTAVIVAGEGNDSVRFKPLFAPLIVDLDNARLDVNTQLGAGDDLLEIDAAGYKHGNFIIDAGEGNDRSNVFAVWVTTGFFNTPRAAALKGASQLTVNALLGDGDDLLEIDAAGYNDANIFINADGGHDAVSNRLYVGNLSFDSQQTLLNIEAHLGDGDDSLDVDATGYDDVTSLVDSGTGADRIRHRMFAIIDRTQLNVDPARLNIAVDLGAGDDSVELETFGYGEIRTSINTGPTGDGLDSASVSHQSLRRRGLVTLHSFDLDGGMDTYDHRSWGYTVQMTVTGNAVVEFLFVA